jgi:hypothetical protein
LRISDRGRSAGHSYEAREHSASLRAAPVIIDALAGAGEADELHPMLQQAKAARPAPKKKAA